MGRLMLVFSRTAGFAAAFFLVCGLLPASAQGQTTEGDLNPIQLILDRQAPPTFTAGQPIEIVVNIRASQSGAITAMGLYETVPNGWTFAGMRGISGQPPSVTPGEGQTGVLQFAWIAVPELPYAFAYTLNVPETDGGQRFISGQLEYRLDGGPQLSPPTITEFSGPDKVPPVIQLLGDNPMQLVQGEGYVEPGYTATDNIDGDVTSRVQVSGQVDTSQPGQYTLVYTASDQAGNASMPMRRVVRVTAAPDNGGTDTGGGTTTAGGTSYSPYGGEYTPRANRPKTAATSGTTASRSATSTLGTAKNATGQPIPNTLNAGPETTRVIIPTGNADGKGNPIGNVVKRLAENVEAKNAEGTDPVASGAEQPAPGQAPAASGKAGAGAPTASTTAQDTDPSAATGGTSAQGAPAADPPMGFFAGAAAALANLSRAQLIALAGAVLASVVLLAVAGFAGKVAYSGPPRRRNGSR
jgi:hypothetical protein